jgi:hypothetical protein
VLERIAALRSASAFDEGLRQDGRKRTARLSVHEQCCRIYAHGHVCKFGPNELVLPRSIS